MKRLPTPTNVCREFDLPKRNLASLSTTLDTYWNVGRPIAGNRQPAPRRGPAEGRVDVTFGTRAGGLFDDWLAL
jgi:hypothetical protein